MSPTSELAEILDAINQPFDTEDARKEAIMYARDRLSVVSLIHPAFGRARYYQGVMETILDNNDAAIAHFEGVIAMTPVASFAAEVYYNMGIALRGAGRETEARTALGVARDLADDPTLVQLATAALA